MINKLTNLPNLIEDLEKPESIIFVFYEGNPEADLMIIADTVKGKGISFMEKDDF